MLMDYKERVTSVPLFFLADLTKKSAFFIDYNKFHMFLFLQLKNKNIIFIVYRIVNYEKKNN